MKARFTFLRIGLATLLLAGCSPGRMAVEQAVDLSLRSLPVYDRETSVDFGAQAVAANLKLLEGLLESAPEDRRLLLALASNYARYAYGFVQLNIECAGYAGDGPARERWNAVAGDLYARARMYGMRRLAQSCPDFDDALDSDTATLAVALATLSQADAAALFWTAFAWGNQLAALPVTPRNLEALGKSAQMMRCVVELDEQIVSGGAHLFLGCYYSRMPSLLGGDPVRAEAHFRRAGELAGQGYLPARLIQAEHAWRVSGDTAAYGASLRDLASAPDQEPEHRLDNAVARRQAGIRLATLDPTSPCDCPGAQSVRGSLAPVAGTGN